MGEMKVLASNLELQLSEIDMLMSMFPKTEEFKLDDPLSERNAKLWLVAYSNSTSKDMLSSPPMISHSLMLKLSDKLAISMATQMVQGYPSSEKPEIYLSSAALTRENQAKINGDLQEHLVASVAEDLVMGVAIAWLQENAIDYFNEDQECAKQSSESALQQPPDSSFCRLWIYSHHIYSKVKRKDILDLGPEYNLTGFCMPGKPGIICLEGYTRDTMDAWSVIKSWNWKKISVKFQEDCRAGTCDNANENRKFTTFEEIGFVKNSENRDYHMDMGEFFNFLKDHNSDFIFKELFGINKSR